MVFNSFQFLLVFLPLCYAGFIAVHRVAGWNGVFPYLALASLAFYAQFSWKLAVILAASVTVNYGLGRIVMALREARGLAGAIAFGAVAANLFALGYFKYTNFFIDIANQFAGTGWGHLDIILPIGISFYTFIQIGFLIEAYNGQVDDRISFGRYALFASFFPCVTAGPLVLQREMFKQMEDRKDPAFSTTALAAGLTMFGIGMFKKVVLADSIAPYADLAFDGVAAGAAIMPVDAWAGALAYSLQLYFDFSGYCDMAIGLGFIFGIRLPLNFNSPFQATSISDFWRRWHMTMTRFFTTFIYTPSAMKQTRKAQALRYGKARRFIHAAGLPIIYTFVIAGIWHGAGWTFVVYGLIHGVALAIDQGWRECKLPSPGPVFGWALTMAVVVSGLVVFRAPDLVTASNILASMWGVNLLTGAVAAAEPVVIDLAWASMLILVYGAIVLCMPNSQEILRSQWLSCDPRPEAAKALAWLRWSPNNAWAAAIAVILIIGFTSLGNNTNFLYYKF